MREDEMEASRPESGFWGPITPQAWAARIRGAGAPCTGQTEGSEGMRQTP